jgi:murein DD-endopeptidase MepM/ murein hydrolase activator NlpD
MLKQAVFALTTLGVAVTASAQSDTAFTKLADGFDFPVGKGSPAGYYKARGFQANGHLGEDWDGTGGGDTDLRDPIYSIGDGVVVFARDVHLGWGNVVIIRHTFRVNGELQNIDSLYGHLDSLQVQRGEAIARGQQIGTMGTAHGMYEAHLHFEIRKNIAIGMSRAAFQRDFSNYYDPTQFIESHRRLDSTEEKFQVAMNTFAHDAERDFDSAPDFAATGHRGGATALSGKALARQKLLGPFKIDRYSDIRH